MICDSDPLILSASLVDTLPVYYRCLARHLADTGRLIIEGSEQPDVVPAGPG